MFMMTGNERKVGLRERTRQAVTREITETANALFIERGYESTTIDDIAEAVGMSRRSVFRYFSTKEDLVLGKLAFSGQEVVEQFRNRPADEPVWESLREVFRLIAPAVDNLDKDAVAAPMQRVIFSTPSLLAAYLGMQQGLQDAIMNEIRDRAARRGAPYPKSDPFPRAVAAAAFGCLVAAQQTWLEDEYDETFAKAIDEAMDAVAAASGRAG